jgi:hypothetical protein
MFNGNVPDEYDGFYFLPVEKEDYEHSLGFQFFNLKDEYENGKPIDGNQNGDMYHIAFFGRDDEGQPIFDDAFEAILTEPTVYIENLLGADLYGCVLRKTDKSSDWFDDYLQKTLSKIGITKLLNSAKSIAEN